jgi:DNA invertase Pin-like site-specific DNA recombinase
MAQYDAVVAYRLDRLTRGDNQSTNDIEKWAHDNHKQLLTVDGLVFPCEGTDGIRWDIAKRLSHEAWLETSERYRRMQTYLRSEGKLVGRPPFGYQVAPADGGHKTLIPTDDGRVYVPEIFARVIAGDNLNDIAKWLDGKDVPLTSGTKWWARSIAGLIRRTTYTGRMATARPFSRVSH